jgi:hypothetical protein
MNLQPGSSNAIEILVPYTSVRRYGTGFQWHGGTSRALVWHVMGVSANARGEQGLPEACSEREGRIVAVHGQGRYHGLLDSAGPW